MAIRRRHAFNTSVQNDKELTGILVEEPDVQETSEFDEEQFEEAMNASMPDQSEVVEADETSYDNVEDMDTDEASSYDDNVDMDTSEDESYDASEDESYGDDEEMDTSEDESYDDSENMDTDEAIESDEEVPDDEEVVQEEDSASYDDEDERSDSEEEAPAAEDSEEDSEESAQPKHRFRELDLDNYKDFEILDVMDNGRFRFKSYEDQTNQQIRAKKRYFEDLMNRHEPYQGVFTRTTTVTETDKNGNPIEKEAIASVYKSDILVCIPYDKYEPDSFWREHGAYQDGKFQPSVVHALLSRRLGSKIVCDIDDIGDNEKVIANYNSARENLKQRYFLANNAPLHRLSTKKKRAVMSQIVQVRNDSLVLDTYGVESVMKVSEIFLTFVADLRMFFNVGDSLLCMVTDINIDKNNNIQLDLSHLATNYPKIIERMESYQSGDTLKIKITYKTDDNQFGITEEGVPCLLPISGNVPLFELQDTCTVRVRKIIYSERPIIATTYVMGQSSRDANLLGDIL